MTFIATFCKCQIFFSLVIYYQMKFDYQQHVQLKKFSNFSARFYLRKSSLQCVRQMTVENLSHCRNVINGASCSWHYFTFRCFSVIFCLSYFADEKPIYEVVVMQKLEERNKVSVSFSKKSNERKDFQCHEIQSTALLACPSCHLGLMFHIR